jgi:D-alanyl-D-alanine dipeptidase
MSNVNLLQIRSAKIEEHLLLTQIAARSKAHWPYDQAYLDLCNQVTHITPDEIREWHFTVAELKGEILGFAGLAPVKDEFMLDHLWIEPKFIGQRIGKVLFENAIMNARKMGLTKFLIASDPYAEKFYLKQGAKRIGERESKVRPGFFLPLLEFDCGLLLIGDPKVKEIAVKENENPFVDLINAYPQLKFDQSRASVQNVSNKIYFVRKDVAEKLVQAQTRLPEGMSFLIKECYRPLNVQRSFWNEYSSRIRAQHPQWSESQISEECSKFIAPVEVAPHSTGGAVDLVLIDTKGELLDMGCEFNASPISCKNATYTAAQNISAEGKRNRKFLMSAMSKVGFVNYPTEFWHWSYGDKYWAAVTNSNPATYSSIENEMSL